MTTIELPVSWGWHYQNFISRKQIVSDPLSRDTRCHHGNLRRSVWPSLGSRTPQARLSSGLQAPTSPPGPGAQDAQAATAVVPVCGGVQKWEEIAGGVFLDNYSIALAGLWAPQLMAVWPTTPDAQ